MTASSMIKKSELNRMADVALQRGVTVWIEIGGRKIGVSPVNTEVQNLDESEEAAIDREIAAIEARNGYR